MGSLSSSAAARPGDAIKGSVSTALDGLVERYPDPLRQGLRSDAARIAFHIDILRSELVVRPKRLKPMRLDNTGPPDHILSGAVPAHICDLGGGIGLFTPGCALAGMEATLVDDFGDAVNATFDDEVLQIHRSLGVTVVKADALDPSLTFPARSFDVVTCFEAMEHWHGSPRRLFGNVMQWLRPGGLFLLSAPNCVDLKRRLSVPLGFGKWSDFEGWYAAECFRGHVRECDRDDLQRIARDLGLSDVRIFGKNWWRGGKGEVALQWAARVLEVTPSLCSTLYLFGRKTG